ncbi:MAG: hypothetical protein NE328_04995, partial [Lentisphaeraceae bacterium]|nr:hypothetical protein [Lentisphaeraceae bacterium]
MEDSIECLSFPDSFSKCKDSIKSEAPVFIEGVYSYNEEDDTRKVIVRNVIPMTDAISAYTTEVHIRLHESVIQPNSINELKEILEKRRNELNDFERNELITASLVYFKESEPDFVYKFSNYLKDSFNACSNASQLIDLLNSDRFGCMNSNTSYLSPEQKNFLIKKFRDVKGKNPVIICVTSNSGDIAFIEAGSGYRLNASWEMVQAVQEKFGENAVRLKVDKSVPEVRRRNFYPRKDKAS